MGFSLHAYIGPAIHVKNQSRPHTSETKSCDNHACIMCGKWQDGRFCQNCGNAIQVRKVATNKEVSLNDFINDESGRFYKWEDHLGEYTEFDAKQQNVWIPNMGPKKMYVYNGSAEDITLYLMDTIVQEEQIRVFEDYFSKMFADMREYGLEFETVYVFKLYSI